MNLPTQTYFVTRHITHPSYGPEQPVLSQPTSYSIKQEIPFNHAEAYNFKDLPSFYIINATPLPSPPQPQQDTSITHLPTSISKPPLTYSVHTFPNSKFHNHPPAHTKNRQSKAKKHRKCPPPHHQSKHQGHKTPKSQPPTTNPQCAG